MKRREFLQAGGTLSAVGALGVLGTVRVSGANSPDLILRRATVYNGSGSPGFEADVAITGDRITAVGRITEVGVEEIDLAGMVLAPGFIDIHSHADLSLLVNPKAESRIRQGITMEIVGQDGSSVGPWSGDKFQAIKERYHQSYGIDIDFRDLGGFLGRLDKNPATVNLATMVGHGTVRGLIVGFEDRPATETELGSMKNLVRKALGQGAVGLSSGLEYTPGSFAVTSELVELAKVLRGTGCPYASHMRNEDDQLLASVKEAIHVGRVAGVPVQISHLKAQGQRNYWKAEVALRMIEEAQKVGVDVSFDRYPYVAYSTGLSSLFPTWARSGGNTAFLKRLHKPGDLANIENFSRKKVALLGSWDAVQITSTRTAKNAYARGRRLGELAKELSEEPFALAVRLIIEEGNSVGMIGFGMSEQNTMKILAHPLGMVCSDGGSYAPYGALSGNSPHPRAYGTFPRLMGHYVRDEKALPLELAVHKVTSMPAMKLGLRDRGVIRVGAFADLVAFDPNTISDRATFDTPHQYPVGIPLVIVNGQVTLRDGEQTGVRAGRTIRSMGVAD